MDASDPGRNLQMTPGRPGPRPLEQAALGAVAGAAGTFMLDRVDWFMWDHEDPDARARTTAVRPGGEPPAGVLVSKAAERAGRTLSRQQHEAAELATHYAIGIAPAVGYALLRDQLPVKGVSRGLLYGLGMFLVQDELLNSVTGLGAKPKDYPWQAHARGLIAHLVYGVSTEIALNALEKAAGTRTSPASEVDPQLEAEQGKPG